MLRVAAFLFSPEYSLGWYVNTFRSLIIQQHATASYCDSFSRLFLEFNTELLEPCDKDGCVQPYFFGHTHDIAKLFTQMIANTACEMARGLRATESAAENCWHHLDVQDIFWFAFRLSVSADRAPSPDRLAMALNSFCSAIGFSRNPCADAVASTAVSIVP